MVLVMEFHGKAEVINTPELTWPSKLDTVAPRPVRTS